MKQKVRLFLLVLTVLSAFAQMAGVLPGWPTVLASEKSVVVQNHGKIEAAFSPRQGAEELVLRVIRAANHEVRLMAYSFTAAEVVSELLAANKRGVDVQIVVDFRNNITEDHSGKARRALSALSSAGIPVRVVSAWALQHSKVVVVDQKTTLTGSYNFSATAATRNSENVLVVWDSPELAKAYLDHWQTRFNKGEAFRLAY